MEDLGFRDTVRSSRNQALWLATLGFFGGFAGVSIFGPLVPKFKELLDLTPFAAGMLAAIPALTGSLLRIPFGAAVERFGGKRPFLILLLITNIGVVGLLVLLKTSYPDSMDGTYPLLLVLGALIGCGIATFSVGIGQVSYWFPKKDQGGALGIYGGLGNTSPGLSTLLLPIAVGSIGILSAYSVWFVILVAVTIVYGLFIKDAPWFQLHQQGHTLTADQLVGLGGGELAPTGRAWAGLKRASSIPATWMLVFFYFLSFGGFLAFTSWLPTFWTSMYDTSLREAGVPDRRLLPVHRVDPGGRGPAVRPGLDPLCAARQLPVDVCRHHGAVVLRGVRRLSDCDPGCRRRDGAAERDRLQAPPSLRAGRRGRRIRLDRWPRRSGRVRHPARHGGGHRDGRRDGRIRPRVPALCRSGGRGASGGRRP